MITTPNYGAFKKNIFAVKFEIKKNQYTKETVELLSKLRSQRPHHVYIKIGQNHKEGSGQLDSEKMDEYMKVSGLILY